MNSRLPLLAPLIFGLFLTACGGGGSSSQPPPPPPVAAPSNLSYVAPPTLVVGTAAATMTPTVTGLVTTYSVAPALPAGLALNTTSGAITGTPTAPVAAANYTVTAGNSGGSTAAAISITVNDLPPVLVAPANALRWEVGAAVAAPALANTGGAVVTWSVAPALPAGVMLNTATGAISGIPLGGRALANYQITAQNSGGSATAMLSLDVVAGQVLLQLGPTGRISRLSMTATRAFSMDASGTWALWNYTSGAMLAGGEAQAPCTSSCSPRQQESEMLGSTVLIRTTAGIDLYSSDDGALLAHIAMPANVTWWKLANDGSYVAAGSPTSLTVWNRNGVQNFSLAGSYQDARAFGAPGELRIGGGAVPGSVQKLSPVSGTATLTAPYAGTFHSWFLDGERFFTNLGNTVYVYSHEAVQADIVALPDRANLGGRGDRFWRYPDNGTSLNIYAVGSSAAPLATYTLPILTQIQPFPSGFGLLSYGVGEFSVLDMSGPAISRANYTVDSHYLSGFGASSAQQWIFGNFSGVLRAGTDTAPGSRTFNCGAVRDITASSSRIAIATAACSIRVYNADGSTLEQTIPFSSSRLAMSADGTILAAMADASYAQYQLDRTLRIYSLPSGVEIHSWPSAMYGPDWLLDFKLSASGSTLSRLTVVGGSNRARIINPTFGGAPIYNEALPGSANEDVGLQLSTSGDSFVIATGADANAATNIYESSVLTAAIPGTASGWLDDNRVIVRRVVRRSTTIWDYDRSEIYNRAGVLQSTLAIPFMYEFQPLAGNAIYSSELNAIYSTTDGAALWTSANPSGHLGAATATHVVFLSRSTVRIEPR